MANNNKSYRIRTKVGREADTFLNVHLEQDYDSLEILSLKISDKDVYKLHNSDYGVIVGRVLANGNFGVPNAKISVFIPADGDETNLEKWNLYPYTSTNTKNEKNIRYNLLPDEPVKDCHVAVGTFPNKTYLLENESIIEVFDDYYLYTTRTNAAGDYLICGVPTGMQTLHMDLDLSDCGILSQRPRDFVYKGYTIEQFENPNQFKKDENIDGLAQIFTQDQPVYVRPFWGNEDNGEDIGITRADIEISFKFEPTCVFMGSAISDNASNGVGKKCVPTNQMGAMDELTAGEGTIEMIRKTPGGNVEEFSIKGNQLIDGNGVWCYQIPMNLDYMMTDEYGNMVPTDDPEKGIPTRTRVRFRASLTDMENGSRSYYRAKYLIPNNPEIDDKKVDYNFGTYTDESSYRDLFWNGVYTVKSYIPRFQKSKRWKSERFSGIKACNYYGGNNPMPYNNLRIKLPFMFTVLCIFVKLFIKIVSLVNRIQSLVFKFFSKKRIQNTPGAHCTFIGDGLCPDMEGWYFAPSCGKYTNDSSKKSALLVNTLMAAAGKVEREELTDETSIDDQNITDDEDTSVCLTTNIDYLLNCFEMNLAQEYRVIKFDFYNDWVNGVLYFPRWLRKIKRKKKYKFSFTGGISTYFKDKVQGCMNSENSNVKKSRYYTQQCSLQYSGTPNTPWTGITSDISCNKSVKKIGETSQSHNGGGSFSTNSSSPAYVFHPSKCHKKPGMEQSSIFGNKSGLVTEGTTMLGQYVYYLKPCEWKDTGERTLLFATDIVLLGTLNECDENGIPQAFKYLSNSSYIMPTNLALTTMDDDAYIYSNDSGTVCSSNIQLDETLKERAENLLATTIKYDTGLAIGKNDFETLDNILDDTPEALNDAKEIEDEATTPGVRRITPDYISTNKAYANTKYDNVDYGDYDDPIPVTEAAGIMWNYSGPGQDSANLGKLETKDDFLGRLTDSANNLGRNSKYSFLYYPGGHFLGLSCVNSDTNIKSCVNLKRICEVGASMSQRREELRGYTKEGVPQYRYYVPTGLISNVDIESAAFRTMFATLNHNKLIATERDDQTGYKKYNFRYLRPDGFDGTLAKYVHKAGSPYNRVVNNDETPEAITDAKWYFEKIFGNSWHEPVDYDPLETKYTETRTVEDTINDYYMFRFGLDTFNDSEQRKHFLMNYGNVHSMPQYENSFYFYFGLKDGATALDEFKKQFFSECAPNNVTKSPSIVVEEQIDTAFTCTATLLINNMLPTYTLTLTDDTLKKECKDINTEKDLVDLEALCEDIDMIVGHQYTITVIDSLDRKLTKTFVFGSSVIKLDAQTVNFRVPGTGTTNDPKKGGYIKISDEITILGETYSIIDDDITFSYAGPEREDSLPSGDTYTDTDGKKWVIFYLPSVGQYEIFLEFEGMTASVYTTTLLDNTDINLYVGCDYLSYKSVGDEPSMVLSGISYSDWSGNTGPFMGSGWTNWLMRHTYYRQTQDDSEPYNHYIYTKNGYGLAIFGQPEKGGLTENGDVYNAGTVYKGDYDQYQGFSLDETYSFIPTLYWNKENGETTSPDTFRNTFDAMSYSQDGRAAADASDVTITDYRYSDGVITMEFTGDTGNIEDGHGALVVLENGTILFAIVNGNTLIARGSNTYPEVDLSQVLPYSTVYPTLCVPSMYKPFYAEVKVAIWNVQAAILDTNNIRETVLERINLPLSYKAEGTVHNGLTFYENRFAAGRESTDQTKPFMTYMVDKYSHEFWKTLSGKTEEENEPMRELVFGVGESGSGVFREVKKLTDKAGNAYRDFNRIEYNINEDAPIEASLKNEDKTKDFKNVLTGRYSKGFDINSINESFDLTGVFLDDLKIRVFDSLSGTNGYWSLYTTSPIPEGLRVYKAPVTIGIPNLFNPGEVLTAEDGGVVYCLGVYNENAEFDNKGGETTVLSGAGDIFIYTKTNEDGTKSLQAATSEDALYSCGVTLVHKYLLGHSAKVNISQLEEFITDQNLMSIRTPEKDSYTPEMGKTGITGFIQMYEKPQEPGSKNKLTVYKLYPFGGMDIMYPLAQEGASGGTGTKYLRIQAAISEKVWGVVVGENSYSFNTNRGEKNITILMSTNVNYKATITQGANWVDIYNSVGNRVDSAEFSSTMQSFRIFVSAYGGDDSRTAYIDIEAQDGSLPTQRLWITQYNSPD